MRPRATIAFAMFVLAPLMMPANGQEQPAASGGAQPSQTDAAMPPANTEKPTAVDTEPAPADAEKAPSADAPKQRLTDAQKSICMLVESAALANGLPVEFFARVIWQESRFRPDAVGPVTRSGKRAQGIAQFMPGTAAERNLLNPMDPVQALPKSAEFLRDLRTEFGNLGLAAAAYNAGPKRVHDWIAGAGSMPYETRNYVWSITGNSIEQWSKAGSDADTKQQGGRDCGTLMALLRREPNRFVASLEQHVVLGSMQPWGSILGADNSRDRILAKYASLQERHSAVLAGLDPILIERRRGPLPRYQVRIGAQTRSAANDLCRQMHKERGDCVVLRNPPG